MKVLARVTRILVALTAALSLLLCLAASAAWVVGNRTQLDESATWNYYWRVGGFPEFQRYHRVAIIRGVLFFQWSQSHAYFPGRRIVKVLRAYPLGFPFQATHHGFSFYRRNPWVAFNSAYWEFAVPLWSVVAVTGILPACRLIAFFRRRNRTLPGQCRACGYDLRATPDRCPECGTVPRQPRQPAQVAGG